MIPLSSSFSSPSPSPTKNHNDDCRRSRCGCATTPNATARPNHQFTTLIGDEIYSIKNQSQLIVTRPMERGYPVDLGCQFKVWYRILEREHLDCCCLDEMAAIAAGGGSSGGGGGGGRISDGTTNAEVILNLLGLQTGSGKKKKKRRVLTPPPLPPAAAALHTGTTAAAAAAAVDDDADDHTAAATSPTTSLIGATGTTLATFKCAIFYLVQPFTPAVLLERIDEIFFIDMNFGTVGKRLIQCMSAYKYLLELTPSSQQQTKEQEERQNSNTKKGVIDDGMGCCCVVDSGFSLTHVVPTVDGRAVECAIRRINVGGKVLTNYLKESISYRQWNMMDEFHIVNEAKEKLCFVSTDFVAEMNAARNVRVGARWFDRDFVLPDFVDTVTGAVRLPPPLQRTKDREEAETRARQAAVAVATAAPAAASCKSHKRGGKKDARGAERAGRNEDLDGTNAEGTNDGANEEKGNEEDREDENGANDDEGDDSDEETEEQRRRRILRQKEEERRRREIEEQERQVLSLSVERFAVPEVLFRPSDIGLRQAGLAEAIVQSIEACEPTLRAAMYHNVLLTGGNANIPFLRERLEMELRSLAPTNYEIRVYVTDDPIGYAWEGARDFAQTEDFVERCCVDRVDWEASRKGGQDQRKLWDKLENKKSALDGLIVI